MVACATDGPAPRVQRRFGVRTWERSPSCAGTHPWRAEQDSEHTLAMCCGNTIVQDEVVLLRQLVETSRAVAATSARREKIARLAELLRALEPAEVPAAIAFLSGELRQRQIGVGWAAVRDATAAPGGEIG